MVAFKVEKVVGKPHPNIYEIIDVFEREEASMKIDDEAGEQPAPRRRRVRQKERRIQNLFA